MTDQTPKPADAGEAADIVERIAHIIDPEVWAEALPIPTRGHTTDWHSRRQKSAVVAQKIYDNEITRLRAKADTASLMASQNRALIKENDRLRAREVELTIAYAKMQMEFTDYKERTATLKRKLDEAANHARILLNENSEVLTSIVEHHVRAIASVCQPAGADSQGEG